MIGSNPPDLFARLRRVSLGLQVAVLLTVAVFPLGLVAVYQTSLAVNEARELSRRALVGEATRVLVEPRRLLAQAEGVASTLWPSVVEDGAPTGRCDAVVARVVADPKLDVIFAAHLSPTGSIACASDGRRHDLAGHASFDLLRETGNRPRTLGLDALGEVTGTPMLVVFASGAEGAGWIMVGLPLVPFHHTAPAGAGTDSFHIALFDDRGRVIGGNGAGWLPRGFDGAALIDASAMHYVAQVSSGQTRRFAIVGVAPGELSAIVSWVKPRNGGLGGVIATALILPLAMWIIALLVSYAAIHRLVIRHVNRLGQLIKAFERGRRSFPLGILEAATGELQLVGEKFASLVQTIARDEAERERRIAEKTILLKEVYHRVKNNLQLIISIMNMQIRNAEAAEAREALRRLQDRVMGLALVHQRLYTAPDLAAVRADELIPELTANIVRAATDDGEGVALETDVAPLELVPETAVPLALFLSEAVTNAVKHAGQGPGPAELSIRFAPAEAGAVLEVANSQGAEAVNDAPGLGSRLIEAFTHQLGGTLRRDRTDGRYILRLSFPMPAKPA